MRVFVYGTLTDPATAGEVLDSFVYTGPAVLEGLHAVAGRHPTLAPGGRVGGRVLRTREVAALDAYEGLDRGVYARVAVPLRGGADASADDAEWDADGATGPDAPDVADVDVPDDAGGAAGVDVSDDAGGAAGVDVPGDDRVAVYVGDPDRLDADAAWPGEGPFRERVERYVADRGVTVRLDLD